MERRCNNEILKGEKKDAKREIQKKKFEIQKGKERNRRRKGQRGKEKGGHIDRNRVQMEFNISPQSRCMVFA